MRRGADDRAAILDEYRLFSERADQGRGGRMLNRHNAGVSSDRRDDFETAAAQRAYGAQRLTRKPGELN